MPKLALKDGREKRNLEQLNILDSVGENVEH